ncbi:MAG: cytochrome c [Candidatus Scalindua sp.]|nr:cytochrome c [Candidatus Scalindua sp.]
MRGMNAYIFIIIVIVSLAPFQVSNTFAGTVDYKKIYKNECQKCHGLDGKGSKRGKKLGAPDFTDAEWQASVTDEQLVNSITHGKKKMPKQEGNLSLEEIKAVVKYVRFFVPKNKRKY